MSDSHKHDVAPSVADDGKHGQIFTHEAFGTIRMSVAHGGHSRLFGSDIAHSDKVRITVQRAKLRRNLSSDWVSGDNLPLIEFEMSHAQFSQFITSAGRGEGTPVTLRYAPPVGAKTERMPTIGVIEEKSDILRREIRESAARAVSGFQQELKKLGAMIDEGKISKVALREAYRNLSNAAGNFASNTEFVVQQSEEAFENIVSHAQIEIESFFTNAAKRVRLERLAENGVNGLLGTVKREGDERG